MKAIKNYAIFNHARTNKGIDFNKATIEVDYTDGDYDPVGTLEHLTPKGYYSQKPLYLDIPFKVEMDGGMEVLMVSEEVGKELVKNHVNLKGKIFRTWWDEQSTNNAVKMKALCNVMHDPYDVG